MSKRRKSPHPLRRSGSAQEGSPERIELLKIDITWDTMADDEVEKLPLRVRDQMDEIFASIHDRPGAVLPALRDLTARFPDVSCLQNWLINALRSGSPLESEEALARSEDLFRKKPKYFFARTTFAELLAENDYVEKAAALMFGEEVSLTRLNPGRKLYHISEIRHWALVCAKIKIHQGELTAARSYRDLLDELEPDSRAVEHLDGLLESDLAMLSKLMANIRDIAALAKKDLEKPSPGA